MTKPWPIARRHLGGRVHAACWMPYETKEALVARARREGLPVNEFVLRLIERELGAEASRQEGS